MALAWTPLSASRSGFWQSTSCPAVHCSGWLLPVHLPSTSDPETSPPLKPISPPELCTQGWHSVWGEGPGRDPSSRLDRVARAPLRDLAWQWFPHRRNQHPVGSALELSIPSTQDAGRATRRSTVWNLSFFRQFRDHPIAAAAHTCGALSSSTFLLSTISTFSSPSHSREGGHTASLFTACCILRYMNLSPASPTRLSDLLAHSASSESCYCIAHRASRTTGAPGA